MSCLAALYQVLIVGLDFKTFLDLHIHLIAGVFEFDLQGGSGHLRFHQQLFVFLQLEFGTEPFLPDHLEVSHHLNELCRRKIMGEKKVNKKYKNTK